MKSEADILEATYDHRAVVSRPMKKRGLIDAFQEAVVYEDLPCAVSFSKVGEDSPTDSTQGVGYVATLFVRPEVEIYAGDRILCTIYGAKRRFVAGEGSRYLSHHEIPLIREGVADGTL